LGKIQQCTSRLARLHTLVLQVQKLLCQCLAQKKTAASLLQQSTRVFSGPWSEALEFGLALTLEFSGESCTLYKAASTADAATDIKYKEAITRSRSATVHRIPSISSLKRTSINALPAVDEHKCATKKHADNLIFCCSSLSTSMPAPSSNKRWKKVLMLSCWGPHAGVYVGVYH
jgi:hypothetical protein